MTTHVWCGLTDGGIPQKPCRSVLNLQPQSVTVWTVNAPPGRWQRELPKLFLSLVHRFPGTTQWCNGLRWHPSLSTKTKVFSLKLNFLGLPLCIFPITIFCRKFTWNCLVVLPTNQPKHQPELGTFTRLSSLNVMKLYLPACEDSTNGVWENVPFKFNFH